MIKLGADDTDSWVDDEISGCLNPNLPRSFFLYAGAGSGKTRSLKEGLDRFRAKHGSQFRRDGRKVAVITYTNAAADEILSRIGEDPLFPVKTIHSFCWEQIRPYQRDIQAWLLAQLPKELEDIRLKHANGRPGKAALDRERAMANIARRLEWLSVQRRFTYNPNGDNFGADSLSHAEVLNITADFITDKPSMQAVLVNKFPFILIDESQDTNKLLMDAFLVLANSNFGRFSLGLFGDTMQRIYLDGKPDLGINIPDNWAKPVKRINHRCAQRIVELGNALRSAVDDKSQLARADSPVGFVRVFIAPENISDKPTFEKHLRAQMADICNDHEWKQGGNAVKILTLEHRMAAARGGFLPMFDALNADSRLSTGLRKGELSGLRLFTEQVAPLLNACSKNEKYIAMAHLRNKSPLLKASSLKKNNELESPLSHIRKAVDELVKLTTENPDVNFLEVLQCVAKHELFDIPDSLKPFIEAENGDEAELDLNSTDDVEEEETEEHKNDSSPSSLESWRAFLETPYNQTEPFSQYVSDLGQYGTHQGVKGLEFDRVLVVIDDGDARGFTFSFDKLLGIKPPSPKDLEKISEGSETSIDHTRRLLYVTCTRAKKSLALVVYTEAPDELAKSIQKLGWFAAEEIKVYPY